MARNLASAVRISFFAWAAASSVAGAASVLPEQFATYRRESVEAVTPRSKAIFDEFGFEQAERGKYADPAKGAAFEVTAWRFHDSTGALAGYQSERPNDSKASALSAVASETATSALIAIGNYLVLFDGRKPEKGEAEVLFGYLPRIERSPLPAFVAYLPPDKPITNSERYVLGPASLEKFEPKVPPSVAAFHLGAEAQIVSYQTKSGPMQLSLFNYPTPAMARERAAEFQKLPGAIAKRSGPLVAVVFSPASPDDAERLLAGVRYQPSITWAERSATRKDNIGDLVINAFTLIGILLCFTVVAGFAFGVLRQYRNRGKTVEDDPAIVSLNLK